MSVNIDFKNIREYDGSKQNGFEELVCQLARLNSPSNGQTFVRKEGSGGDAGVECFWICSDGTECAWQAKYFLEVMDSSQWSQVNDSVLTAIEKHPKMTEYYICVPRDRTDSRKEYQGRAVTTALDTWNEYEKKWKEAALLQGRSIRFIYWGKSELLDILQQDDPVYSGKVLYWFNEAVITSKKLQDIIMNAQTCLGERFTPENHVDLPIIKKFSCIARNAEWKKEKEEVLINIHKTKSDFNNIMRSELLVAKDMLLADADKKYKKFVESTLLFKNDDEILFSGLDTYKTQVDELIDILNELSQFIFGMDIEDKKDQVKRTEINRTINKATSAFSEFRLFFESKEIQAGSSRRLLLTGEAGSGKSHLLCDFSKERIGSAMPTVLMLGEHYHGGDPIKFLAETVGLENHSNSSVLGALDALGETYNTNTVIVIDAINEGNYREDWFTNLNRFLTEIEHFKNIAVIISCRNTYKDFIIPNDVLKCMPEIIHTGFKGFEKRASLKYLGKLGISLPAVPFFAPEFSNPLFLKITCKAIKEMGLKEFPKGLNGYNKLFEFYLESIQNVVRRVKKTYRTDTVHNVITDFVKSLFPGQLWGIPIAEAEGIINKYDSGSNAEGMLSDILIREGLFARDVEVNNDGIKHEILRFTYERFSDFAIANSIIDECENEEQLRELFEENGTINKIISGSGYWGIIKALGIAIPEKYHKELMEFLSFEEGNKWRYNHFLEGTFAEGILLRSKESITEKSLDLLNKMRGGFYENSALDILLALSTEPEHPWNAEFLDKNLLKRTLAERDHFWSTYIATNDYIESEGQSESPFRTIINWAMHENLLNVESDRLYLVAIVLLWICSTPKRMTRQSATKALAQVLSKIPDRIPCFLNKYSLINDSYVVCSLYAASYGAIIYLDDNVEIGNIVECVIQNQFSEDNENPHILIRDYARGIIEFAYFKRKYEIGDIEKYRPPYISEWPMENPLPSEIKKLGDEYSSIKSSVQGGLNDFGKYTMCDVEDWTATKLSENRPKTCYEFNLEFAETLPEELKNDYKSIIGKRTKDESERKKGLREWLNSIKANANEKRVDEISVILEEYSTDVDEYQCDAENQNDDLLEEDLLYEDPSDEEEDLLYEDPTDEEEELLLTKINDKVNEEQREYLKWLRKEGVSDRIAKADIEWAKRWVVKRAYSLGWTSKLFDEFESMYCQDSYRRNGGLIERIGKKYQWIAYYELLEHLSGNLYFNNRGYSDVDDSRFWGPWQIDVREMDPTFWFEAKKEIEYDDKTFHWWRPYIFQYDSDNLEEQKKWLWDEATLPDFKNIICTKEPGKGRLWITLYSFCNWKHKSIVDDDNHGEPQLWYRINTCIISRDDLENIKTSFANKQLRSPDLIYIPNTNNQRFWGEYPWHPCYDNVSEWIEEEEYQEGPKCKYHVPLYEYSFSTSGFEHMDDESISFYMPSKKIVEDMNLEKNKLRPGEWLKDGNTIFMDSGMEIDTQPCALFEKEIFCEWLKKNDYVLIWLVGGEKELFTPHVTRCFGRLNYSALYHMDGTGVINGEMWSEEEKPYNIC